LNFYLTAEEAAYILEDSGATVWFVDTAKTVRGLQASGMANVGAII
jgi:hypothetical protein